MNEATYVCRDCRIHSVTERGLLDEDMPPLSKALICPRCANRMTIHELEPQARPRKPREE